MDDADIMQETFLHVTQLLPAESARFLLENACDFCTEIARFNRLFARNRMFSARSRRLILAYLHA